MKLFSYVLLSIGTMALLTGCTSANAKSSNASQPTFAINNKVVTSSPQKKNLLGPSEGVATYYSLSVNGRPTASGEIFNNKKLTAAHKTLPFGTYVRVTALWNNKSVIVRIIDRGPYGKGRVIDLSQAAAKQLQLIGKGVGKVRLEVVSKPSSK